MGEWIISGAAALSILACLIAFIKTPSDQRYRFLPLTLEERLASYQAKAQAVIIKANKKQAIINALPALCLALTLIAFDLWSKSLPNW